MGIICNVGPAVVNTKMSKQSLKISFKLVGLHITYFNFILCVIWGLKQKKFWSQVWSRHSQVACQVIFQFRSEIEAIMEQFKCYNFVLKSNTEQRQQREISE